MNKLMTESELKEKLSEYEIINHVKPIGINYTCEFCKEGEQRVAIENGQPVFNESNLIKHTCTKCENEMYLPRIYPYIEWVKEEE